VLKSILAGAITALFVLASASPAPAADPMTDMNMGVTRFSRPGVYTGPPALPVTLSMIVAGGGPNVFSAVTLVKALAGSSADAELAKLGKQYGSKNMTSFVTIFKFVVDDSLAIVAAKKIALPATPDPSPTDGRALSTALWNAGLIGNQFNVEVMLDRAVSHPIHLQVMKDIDAKYGLPADAEFHIILATAMNDLAAAYKLAPAVK